MEENTVIIEEIEETSDDQYDEIILDDEEETEDDSISLGLPAILAVATGVAAATYGTVTFVKKAIPKVKAMGESAKNWIDVKAEERRERKEDRIIQKDLIKQAKLEAKNPPNNERR